VTWGRGYPVTSAPKGVADQGAGVSVVQRVRCSTETPAPWSAKGKPADVTGYPLEPPVLSGGAAVVLCGGGPGDGFVVGGVVAQAAVQDADEAAGQASQGVVVADVASSQTVVVGAGAG
jgi:hypothetical protein